MTLYAPEDLTDYTPKILVVDDEARIRDACRLVLEEAGYAVEAAGDGAQGIALIDERHYDIILLDLMMPALSGFDVLARIKDRHPDTVVIIITGYATLEHSVEAMKKGAFDFIPKPFTPDHLRITVAKAIEHTRALRDIAETHSRIRTMVNCLSDGVMCTNRRSRVVLVNQAFLRVIGHGTASVIGCHIDEFLTLAPLPEMITQALATNDEALKESCAEIEIGQTGTGTVLSARCLPFKDRSGQTVGVITVLHDITALKQMDRMKSDFVSMVSHEIRGPMTSVMMQLRVILDGLAGEITAKQTEILERASDKINSLIQMASELLDLARIESGLITLTREQVRMADLLREQIDFHRPRAEAAGLTTHLDCPDDLPPILANRRNMEEVISNLLTNAIKYTPAGGRVTVAAARAGDYVCVRVQDTGFGIAPEDLTRIFERFYRVKDEHTRFIQGTGLGLPIVKSILDSHHGHLEVNSRPGAGTLFCIYLPIPATGAAEQGG